MLTNEEIFAKDKSDYLPVFARYNIVLDHGDGPYVYDTKGKKLYRLFSWHCRKCSWS